MSSDDKATLKLQVEQELRDRIEATAAKEGLSVSAWVRRTLLSHFDMVEAGKIVQKVIDAQHPEPPTPPSPSPAAPAAPAPQVPVALQMPPNMHPCTFLNPVIPSQYNAAECQGTCQNQQRGGGPCFWASNVARQCQTFRPKMAVGPGARRP